MKNKVSNHTKSLFCTVLTAVMLFSIIVGAGIALDDGTRTSAYAAASAADVLSFSTENGTFTVGAVKELSAKANGDDSILLDWEAVAGASGYAVYSRNIDKNGKFELYERVNTSGCILTDLAAGTAYEFKIAAYVAENEESYEGNAQSVRAATQPEAVKLELTDEESEIKLKWSESGNAEAYEIYKSVNGGDYTLSKTVSKDATSYTDSDIEDGSEYSYKVRALRTLDDEVYYSEYSSVSYSSEAPSESLSQELETPSFTLSTSSSGSLTVSWSETSDNPDGYEIQYSQSQNGDYTTLATLSDTSYTTDDLTSGKTYYFKVFAFKYYGDDNSEKHMSDSEIASITIGSETTVTEETDKSSTDSDNSGSSSSSDSYDSDNGDTYIKVSIEDQYMWFYKDGELMVETPVVTGNYGTNDTPRGTYYIIYKQSPAVLMENSYVTYWMPFTQSGCGIHDASWRNGEFGGTIYKGNGSHGCVNTPYSAVETIYNNVSAGTTVIVE